MLTIATLKDYDGKKKKSREGGCDPNATWSRESGCDTPGTMYIDLHDFGGFVYEVVHVETWHLRTLMFAPPLLLSCLHEGNKP